MGKLDRIARAFGYHAHSMQLSAKEGQPQDFQTDPLPNLKDQSQLSTFIFGMNNLKGYQAIDYSPNIRFFKERGWRAVEAGYPIHPTP
jgi:hypothetical protein